MILFLAAAGAGVLWTPANAADALVQQIFADFDDNGDQRIDRSEFRFNKIKVFDHRDVDNDNYLTFEETAITRQDFVAADFDKDAKLSSLEWIDARYTKFDLVDANADGIVTMPEFERFAGAVLRDEAQ